MKIDIVNLPKDLTREHLLGRAVVVFDVLRATTTMVTALASGAKEIRVFESIDGARLAAGEFDGPKLLAGEQNCLAPPGFDLGNSPGDFAGEIVAGKTIFLSTTNGTRAILAAQGAARLFVAAVVNATATANKLISLGMDVTLICSGTNGEFALEDRRGAELVGGVLRHHGFEVAFRGVPELVDFALKELSSSLDSNKAMRLEFRRYPGGRNILKAGLERDIDFAAQADRFDTVVEVTGLPPVARKVQ